MSVKGRGEMRYSKSEIEIAMTVLIATVTQIAFARGILLNLNSAVLLRKCISCVLLMRNKSNRGNAIERRYVNILSDQN